MPLTYFQYTHSHFTIKTCKPPVIFLSLLFGSNLWTHVEQSGQPLNAADSAAIQAAVFHQGVLLHEQILTSLDEMLQVTHQGLDQMNSII